MADKVWNECRVAGTITACDPGRLTCSGSSRSYSRDELSVGMNLCAFDDNLPSAVVRSVGFDNITVRIEGRTYKVTTGGRVDSPRKGLSYAYSEVSIYLK